MNFEFFDTIDGYDVYLGTTHISDHMVLRYWISDLDIVCSTLSEVEEQIKREEQR